MLEWFWTIFSLGAPVIIILSSSCRLSPSLTFPIEYTCFYVCFLGTGRRETLGTRLPLDIRGWQGWSSGESTCLPPMWPRFNFHTRCHMWIEFVGSLLCSKRFFPGYSGPVFPSHQKPPFDLIWFVNNNCKIVIWAMLIWFPLEL